VSPRETTGRGFIVLAGLVALGAVLACPHPAPAPVTPDASDAAPSPSPVTCGVACLHAVNVCPGVNLPTCKDICPREPPAYAQALMAATGCPGVKAADPGSVGAKPGAPRPVGH
jgi:hypothetical protein